ncbi:acetyltransferase [Vibrio sp. T20]|uniref:acetyltransferase n=1 Tax=Vibrio sp. T20 TaxID=2588450 RepID=UPI0011B71673|nr:acetyltransferase [Vibrio sp. T20]
MKLFLIGAGGFAREVYSYLESTDLKYGGYEFAGFLTDFDGDLNDFNYSQGIVGPLLNENLPYDSKLIMAVSDPCLKDIIYSFYEKKGIEFLSYIHPTATVGTRVTLGQGTVICPNATLTTDIIIGKCVTINAHSSIGHDASIGDFSTLSGHCDVTGFVSLGKKAFMGSHALVIPNTKVGDSAIIGAGSVVISKVKQGVTVFGNPAKKIK